MLSLLNSECFVDNSVFSKNYAGTKGGVIYSYSFGELVSITCTSIEMNKAGEGGGALYLTGNLLVLSSLEYSIENVSFVANVADSDSGGAIFSAL